MNDLVVYEPSVTPPVIDASFSTRLAVTEDVHAIATVMSARDGTDEGHVDHSRKMIERLDFLLIAEQEEDAVRCCGVQKLAIHPGVDPQWLIIELCGDRVHRRRGSATEARVT